MEAKAAGLMQSIDFQTVLTGEKESGSSSTGDTDREVSVDKSSIGATTPQKPRKKEGSRRTKKRPPSE